MRKELSLINKCKSWKECNQQIAKLTIDKKAKLGGSIFEHVVKLYLQTEPKYQTKFKQVWLLDEVPHKVKQLLRLPQVDEGIDLVVQTNDDEYWSVQAKYRSNIDETLVFAGKGGLSTFQSLSFVTCKNISHGLICATVNKPPVKKHLLKNIGFEVADTWLSLDENNCAGWKRIQAKAKGKKLIVKPATPRPHQRNAIKEAKKHFLTSKNTRGKMIMPCGTGKSLASFWIAHELKAKNIIIAVPSIALIKQTLNTWATESILNKRKIDWLCVCSDESVDNDQDEIISNTSDLGIKPTTNQKEIEKFLKNKTKNLKVIFTTYQSGIVTAKAARKIKTSFDLGLFDEAHKTVGHKEKQMAHLIFEKNIKIKKRLFMTATERLFRLNSTEYLSMDNKDNYGEIFYQLSFKKAIDAKPSIISDYKVITIGIDEEEIKTLVQKNKFLKLRKKIDNITARELAVGIALRKAIKKYNIKNTLTFHSSIRRANNFSSQQEIISNLYPKFGKLDSFHVHGGMNASERSLLLKEFGNSSKSLMTNARCLTEGIDLPSIDCVCFTDPKKSKTDIVQAAGRALRLSKSKKFGYILIPVNITKSKNSELASNDKRFNEIISIVGALSSQDTRISEYLRSISMGHKTKGSNPIDGINKIISYTNIDKNYFEQNIKIQIWNKIASFNYRDFHDAKDFIRGMKVKNVSEWNYLSKSNKIPKDIPQAADRIYKNQGWVSWGDFLGTNRIANSLYNFVSFKEARSLIQKLGIKKESEYYDAHRKGKLPNLPYSPTRTYKKSGEWKGWGDFTGSKNIAFFQMKWAKLDEIKKRVREMKIQNSVEYKKLWNEGKFPKNYPKKIDGNHQYEGEWTSWGDFFGHGKPASHNMKYISFKKLKKLVRENDCVTEKDYAERCWSKDKLNLPRNPYSVKAYKGQWKGWGDLFGHNIKNPHQLKRLLSYEDAKIILKKNKITTFKEYKEFYKKNKNIGLPSDPSRSRTYKIKWKSWGDFLGTDYVRIQDIKKLNYKQARKHARSLKLKDVREWYKLKNLPSNIPKGAYIYYKKNGEWISWKDFLGLK